MVLDSKIRKKFSVIANQEKVTRLENQPNLIYPVDFRIFGQVEPNDLPNEIPPKLFQVVEKDGQVIDFTVFNARMFDYYYALNRGTMLADESLEVVNSHLKKGRISFCTAYDALLLWESFSKKPIASTNWIGVRPLKTQNFDDGIFQLRNDSRGKTRLLLGDMYSAVTFSSECNIIVRYQANP